MASTGILTEVLTEGEKLLEAILGTSSATSTIGTVSGVTVTLGGVKDVATIVEAIQPYLREFIANAGDLSNDADIAAIIAQTLGDVGVPIAGNVGTAIEILKWMVQNSNTTTLGTPYDPDPHHSSGR